MGTPPPSDSLDAHITSEPGLRSSLFRGSILFSENDVNDKPRSSYDKEARAMALKSKSSKVISKNSLAADTPKPTQMRRPSLTITRQQLPLLSKNASSSSSRLGWAPGASSSRPVSNLAPCEMEHLEEDAAKEDLVRKPGTVQWQQQLLMNSVAMVVVAIFWGLVLVLCEAFITHPQMTPVLEEAKITVLGLSFTPCDIEKWAGISFASAAFNHMLAVTAEIHAGKSYQLALAQYSCTIGALTALSNLSNLSPLFKSNFGGSVSPVRYLMWIFNTPALVLMAHGLSDSPMREGYLAVGADVGMIFTGFLMEVLEDLRLAFLAGVLSFVCYFYVLAAVSKFFNSAMRNSSARSIRFMAISKWSVLILWNLFPALFAVKYLVPGVDAGTFEALNTLVHYITKVLFVEVLVHDFSLTVAEKEALAATAKEEAQNKELVQELQQLVKQKDTFLSATSHELRTPLHGIIGLTQGIIGGSCGEVNPRMERFLHTIEISGNRLLKMINNILDSAAMEANNGLDIANERVTLLPVLQHAIQLISTLIKESVEIVLDVDDNLPDVLGDEGRIGQILNNLLGNAAKFTEQGTITVHAGLDGDPEDERTCVKVSVTDTGCGIPENCQQRVFLPFTQVHDVRTRKYGGTGLGLSLVHSLVEAQGGKVTVRSEMDVGTTFAFTLKRAKGAVATNKNNDSSSALDLVEQDDLDLRKAQHSSSSLCYPAHSGDMRPYYKEVHGQPYILSIDDDPVNHMVLEGFLKPKGFKLGVAMSGPEALDLLKNCETLPDLILLDCMMPTMSGYEVNAAIREILPGTSIPVIMVSAKSTDEDVIEGLKSGSHDYIKKPFHQGELLARIEANIALKDSWRQEMEAKLSTKLLEKILPQHIIRQLNSGMKCVANDHPETSILFSDVVGFTVLASSMSTKDVVVLLNDMFSIFDNLVDKHGIYKVETIGDAYMAASGHDEKPDHATRLFSMACDMIKEVRRMKYPEDQARLMESEHVQIRVGLHTGPCYTGVVGIKCPRYCFFGDTVNTASRMESSGSPMCVQMSKSFFEAVSPKVWEDFQGKLMKATKQIKGKGRMEVHLATTDPYTPLPQIEDMRDGEPTGAKMVVNVQPTITSVTQFLKNQCSAAEICAVMRDMEGFVWNQAGSWPQTAQGVSTGAAPLTDTKFTLILHGINKMQDSIGEGMKERLESIEQNIQLLRTEAVQEVQERGNAMQPRFNRPDGEQDAETRPTAQRDTELVEHTMGQAHAPSLARISAPGPSGFIGGRLQSLSSEQDGRKPRSSSTSCLSPALARQKEPLAYIRTRNLGYSRLRSRSHADLLRARRNTPAPELDQEREDVRSSEDSESQKPFTNWYTAAWNPNTGGDAPAEETQYWGQPCEPADIGLTGLPMSDSKRSSNLEPHTDNVHPAQQMFWRQNRQATYPSSACGMSTRLFGSPHDKFVLTAQSVGCGTELRNADIEVDFARDEAARRGAVGQGIEDTGSRRTPNNPGHVSRERSSPRSAPVNFPAELANMNHAQDEALTMFLSSVLNEFELVRRILVKEDVDLAILMTLSESQLKDLGIAPLGTRMRIVNGAKQLLTLQSFHEA